jgi:hypothetical protein
MVLGIIGGFAALVSGVIDMIAGNLAGGIVVVLSCIALLAISAMTPSLPGWSALLFVVASVVFLLMSSVAAAFSAPLLLIAAILGALASRAKRRASAARVT